MVTKERMITVRKQSQLSLAKVMRLVRSGIRHRLLRSTLTMAVVLLAVAFFMTMLSESVFTRSVANGVFAEVRHERLTSKTLGFLFSPPSSLSLAYSLAKSAANDHHEDTEMIDSYKSVTKMDINGMIEMAIYEIMYLDFFEKKLRVEQKSILFGSRQGRDALRQLQEKEAMDEFIQQLEQMRSVRLPSRVKTANPIEEFTTAFYPRYYAYLEDLSILEAEWRKGQTRLKETTDSYLKKMTLEEFIALGDKAEVEEWRVKTNELGFALTVDRVERMRNDLKLQLDMSAVERLLNKPEKREQWQRELKEKINLDAKMMRLGEAEVVRLINTPPAEQNKNRAESASKVTIETENDTEESEPMSLALSQSELKKMADSRKYARNLANLETFFTSLDIAPDTILTGRQLFLLIISFIVCMVGIANAMLMAITERFREIATMKCLGATDRFILTQFMLEASIQGVVGGAFGLIVGLMLALIKGLFAYGSYLWMYFPVSSVLLCMAASLFAGILLAVFASLYPSWAASRMAPMEAMRVE